LVYFVPCLQLKTGSEMYVRNFYVLWKE
jgi:hypothetical protein